MEMDFEWMVAETFGSLAGLDENERLPFLPMCILCAGQVKRGLKSEDLLLKHAQELSYAAAANAFYRYVLLRAALDEDSFRAGDVSVNKNPGAEKAAAALRDEASAAVSSLLEPEDFVFRQVM